MTPETRNNIISTITQNEGLRPLSRGARLLKDPLGAIPYYFLAALSRIKPYQIHFQTLWGTPMTCFLPEGNTFYYYGYCEANLTNFYLRYVQAGMVVIDVGAHVGIYSMLSSELVGTTGRVFSFEPTPWTFKILSKNTELLTNVSIFNEAISETKQTLTFADYGPGYGAYNSASLFGAPDTTRPAQSIEVVSDSLDNFFTREQITPDIIKIDSEGYEFEVLQGMKNTLENRLVPRPLISIEVAGGEAWAKNSHQAFELLTNNQYLPYQICVDGTISLHSFKDTYTYDNLLFIPVERIQECNHLLQ